MPLIFAPLVGWTPRVHRPVRPGYDPSSRSTVGPVEAVASPRMEMLESFSAEVPEPLLMGFIDPNLEAAVLYGGGIASLVWWERAVVPILKRRGIVPDVPLVRGALTERQKDLRWITPLTCDNQVPPPALEDLRTRKRGHRVGTFGGVHQLISLNPSVVPQGNSSQSCCSPEWSEYYNTTVYIFKKKVK